MSLSVYESSHILLSPLLHLHLHLDIYSGKMNMNKWVPLAPNKPGQPSTPSRFNVLKPSKPITRTSQGPFIGRFPEVVVLNIVSFLPIPDLPNVARGCKALARVVRDERGWETRCKVLGLKAKGMSLFGAQLMNRTWDAKVTCSTPDPEAVHIYETSSFCISSLTAR